MTQSPYEHLQTLGKEIKYLESIVRLLDWDRNTMLPANGADVRALQEETLSGIIHQKMTSKEFIHALEACIDLKSGAIPSNLSLTEKEKASLKEWRRDVNKALKLPSSFVKELAKTISESATAWDKAKKHNDFNTFLPYLEKIIHLCKQKAEFFGYAEHPYDALLDEYEPGMTCKKLDVIFSKLKPFLIELTKRLTHKHTSSLDLKSEQFDADGLKALNHLILNTMTMNEASYRVDTSSHPFCSGMNSQDVRLTVHERSSDIMSGHFSALMHEAGHALYELQLPQEHFGNPLCEASSTGIHESQSKLWENHIGRSLPFVSFFMPHLKQHFPTVFGSQSAETLYHHMNQIEPSFIRIHADEVTYGLHVILRYEIEKGLFDGSIQPKDIPSIWNEKMHLYLGITPSNYKEGCLQDIHWSLGYFGYFPTYVLGNLYAAQLFETIEHQFPDTQTRIAHGDWKFIAEWLKEHIHRYGRQYSPSELIHKASGKELMSEPFMHYLTKKFQ